VRVRAHETSLVQGLHQGIQNCLASGIDLPGIQDPAAQDAFVNQLVDSIRRVKYVSTIALPGRSVHPNRREGAHPMFDPLKAAIYHLRKGQVEEACWLVFLFVHFGRHPKSGWRYTGDVYGALGSGGGWTWDRVRADPESFRHWLRDNEAELQRGNDRGFGNHRKYISMSADKPAGTGAAVVSYVEWILQAGSHQALFQAALSAVGGLPERAFDVLYHSMRVKSFGRMAKFDYLTMIGKLRIANIKPGLAYVQDSTGPADGARAMFQVAGGPRMSNAQLEQAMAAMARHLNVGMQEMEDSICNWQKSPIKYKYFGG
jgi:hypothetical protein